MEVSEKHSESLKDLLKDLVVNCWFIFSQMSKEIKLPLGKYLMSKHFHYIRDHRQAGFQMGFLGHTSELPALICWEVTGKPKWKEHVDKSSYSSLKITGDFSADLIRDWLSSCLDDLPKDSIDWFHYRNNFTQSGLQVNLADNSCLIMSNNVSSLSVIRDSILARSIQGNMQVNWRSENSDFQN